MKYSPSHEHAAIAADTSTEQNRYRELGTPGSRNLAPTTILTTMEQILRFPVRKRK